MIFTCHFNFFKNPYREQLLNKFTSTYPKCKVIEYSDLNNIIFIKENLLNNLISQWIEETDYVFWVDYDVEFIDKDWYNKAIDKLNEGFDIIQPFDMTFHENKHSILIQKQPGYVSTKKTCNTIYGHCGFAWGMTKKTFLHLKGLYEYNIFGTSDGVMSSCFTQSPIPLFQDIGPSTRKLPFYPFSQSHCSTIQEYYKMCRDLKSSFIQGTVIHRYHGELWRRNYINRYKLYEQNNFDPQQMLFKENNILKIKPEFSSLKKDAEAFLKFKETI